MQADDGADARLVRLDGRAFGLLLDARGDGVPVLRHLGPALGDQDLAALADALEAPPPRAGLDRPAPLTLLPEFGLGWFAQPGIAGTTGRRHYATAFRFAALERVREGLLVRCCDEIVGLALDIEIALDPGSDVLSLRTRLTNHGALPYRLDWCAAGVVPLPSRMSEGLAFSGHWAQEFREERFRFGSGVWLRESRRGRTSHDSFPGLIVGTPGFAEERGEVIGVHLGWSGNHRFLVEQLDDGGRQVQLGGWLAPGEVELQPGESYASPTVYLAHAADGMNGLRRRFHRFVRDRMLAWPGGAMRPRPVLLNTWEAIYFDHDLDRLKRLAEVAARVGVERFVLDDGWFKGRNDDRAGLGDWVPDPKKYPGGLGPLVDHVRGLGMEFGLWIEPEMINPASELYRAHPDWALRLEGRPETTGRNQLVLDLARPEVQDHLYAALDRLLREHPIAYLKWDMNRDLAPAASDGIASYRRQTLAVYALMERLRAAHPAVEIESCAAGGGRIDFGVLPRVQRFWTSDSNDALERQTIQRGFGRFFPPEIMGAHIGPCPAHTTGRMHTLHFRAATALFGHLGLELDLLTLDDAELDELAGWIALHKRLRPVLHQGHVVRADGEGDPMVHGVVAADRSAAVFAVVQTASPPTRLPAPVRLPGLAAERRYRIAVAGPPPPGIETRTRAAEALLQTGLVLTGSALADAGLRVPRLLPESALLLELEALA